MLSWAMRKAAQKAMSKAGRSFGGGTAYDTASTDKRSRNAQSKKNDLPKANKDKVVGEYIDYEEID
jgi:hypothetical protein